MTVSKAHELNKADCLVCGAKHSITRVIETIDSVYYVYCICAVCSSECSDAKDFELSKLLNKRNTND